MTGEGGGGAVEWGVAEGEEAVEEGVEVEEGGMARWEVEGGGGGLETLMWTLKRGQGQSSSVPALHLACFYVLCLSHSVEHVDQL